MSARLSEYGPARRTDPETSKIAHQTIAGNTMRWKVLSILAHDGPMSDDRLRSEHLDRHASHSSSSTRRNELWRLGLVAEAGEELNERGNRCLTWKVTPEGIRLLADGSERQLTAMHRDAEAERSTRGGNSHPAIADMERFCDDMRRERDLAFRLLSDLACAAFDRDKTRFAQALQAARGLLEGGTTTT